MDTSDKVFLVAIAIVAVFGIATCSIQERKTYNRCSVVCAPGIVVMRSSNEVRCLCDMTHEVR
jgi:hypothetical protein